MVAVNIRKDGDTLAGYKDAAENEIGEKSYQYLDFCSWFIELLRSGDAHDSKAKNLE